MINIKTLATILLLSFSSQLVGQSIILDLLFTEAKSVFKGRVEQFRVGTSNAEGTHFGVYLRVEEVYKGSSQFEQVSYGVTKFDVIDLEFDTMIMDYSFQIRKDSTYVFFTKDIREDSKNRKVGHTSLLESEIEGIPYSEQLEQVLIGYDPFIFLTAENRSNYPISNFAFYKMKANSDTVFVGEVLGMTEEANDMHRLRVLTRGEEREVIIGGPNCICRSGEIEIGNEYVLYTTRDENNQLRIIDEWLGIIEASEYDRFRASK